MATATLLPASVSYSWGEQTGEVLLPDSAVVTTSTEWEAGSPLVLSGSTGKVKQTVVDGTSGAVLTTAGNLVALSGEKFEGKRFAVAVDGFSQKELVSSLLTPGAMVEANIYVDGNGGASETISQDMMFASVHMKKIANGKFVFDPDDSTSSAMVFKVVHFIDSVGTVNGRVLAVPAAANILPN